MASRSNVGPLTTTFVPPASCSVYAWNGWVESARWWLAQSCFSGSNYIDNAGCWPPATTTLGGQGTIGAGFYSPGLVCPFGYTSACAASFETGSGGVISVSGYPFQFSIVNGETAIGCCPSGLSCETDGHGAFQRCDTTMLSGSVATVGTCVANTFDILSIPLNSGVAVGVGSGSSSIVTVTTAVLKGPLVQLVFRSSDIIPASTTSSPLASSTSQTVVGPTPTPTGVANSSDQSLSTGAKAGLAVGVVLGVVLILSIIAWLLIRYRRRGQSRTIAHEMPVQEIEHKSTTKQNQNKGKLLQVVEAPNHQEPRELDAKHDQRLAELDSTYNIQHL